MSIIPAVRLINNGTQPITSAQISYSYNGGEAILVNWSGNLGENQSSIIDLSELNSDVVENLVSASLINVNGSATGINEISISDTYLNLPTHIADVINIEINTDALGRETSWELLDAQGTTIDSRPTFFYQNSQTYTHSIALQPGCYTFIIRDSYGDGICCSQGVGDYKLTTGNGDIIREGGSFNTKEFVRFKISNLLSTEDHKMEQQTVSPNPTTGIFRVVLTDLAVGSGYEIYNLMGQKVAEGKLKDFQNYIDVTGTAEGVYLLKVMVGAKTKVHKIIISN